MTKVSRKRISKEGRFINDFWRVVTFLGNKEEVKNFLKALLTPTEMLMLSKRVEVAKLLIMDEHYDDIRRQAQVTNSMITHTRDSLARGGYEGYIKPLQRLVRYDGKIANKKQRKLEHRDLSRTTFSLELTKVLGKRAVKQYEKWHRFRSATN